MGSLQELPLLARGREDVNLLYNADDHKKGENLMNARNRYFLYSQ